MLEQEPLFRALARHRRGGGSVGRRPLQAGGEPEPAAHAGQAVQSRFAAHQRGKLLRDRQAQARATVLPAGGVVRLLEGREQLVLHGRVDADAGVFDLEAHHQAGGSRFGNAGADRDRAVARELDGIHGVVEQGLLQPRRVAQQLRGQVARLNDQPEVLRLGPVVHQRGDAADHCADRERGFLQRELPGLDLGQVQHRVDDFQQVPAGGVDGVQAFGLPRGHAVALEQVRHAGDRVQRRADLVAHVGQEGALRDVGGLGSQLGLGQLDLVAPAGVDAPQVVADDLQFACVGLVVIGGLVAHADQHPGLALFDHRHAEVALEFDMALREAVAMGQAREVVVRHGLHLPHAVRPDTGLGDRVVRIVGG